MGAILVKFGNVFYSSPFRIFLLFLMFCAQFEVRREEMHLLEIAAVVLLAPSLSRGGWF